MKDQNPFKQKLYNHTLPVRDDVWKHVEATLPAPRRRLPFLWLSLAGFLLLGASVIGLSLRQQNLLQSETPENNTIQELKNTTSSQPTENKITSISSEYSTKESNTLNSQINTSGKNQAASSIRNSSKGKSTQAKTILAVEDSNNHADVSPGDLRNSSVFSGLQMLPAISLLQTAESNEMSSIKPDPSCYKFKGKNGKNALSFDLFAGPGFAPRTFEDTEGGPSPYAMARNDTEKSQYAWGAGARINLNLQQGFAVRLGILYEQIGDKFNYTDPGATQQHMVLDSFFAADGTFLYSEVTTVTILGTLIKKIHNRYTHIDIPLLISYELPFGRSLLMINAGPVLNLTSSQKGQILDPSLNPVHITQGTPDELKAYKNNLGFSVYLGAGALFPLTENISALVEPRLLYRINPVTLDTYPLKEHRSFAGLNLGIRYHFN